MSLDIADAWIIGPAMRRVFSYAADRSAEFPNASLGLGPAVNLTAAFEHERTYVSATNMCCPNSDTLISI